MRLIRLASDADWGRVAAIESAAFPQFGAFPRWRLAGLRALCAAGRGAFYALEDERGRIVACAGGYHRDGLARFANVLTVAEHRRRGYGRLLLAEILRALRPHAGRAMIVADAGSAGEALYRSLGFVPFVSPRSLIVAPAAE